ncbi:thiolase family protein [Actinocrispum wychmicini]|uniref:Acetyl-CoA acyltransferase n=1 Tax=Actinocrispum wychmicini TaxID=1213861 RepID=A0A4R2JPK9_9PSEU|nr:thiolase family protein [Actinocrispum wychmicini]TCO62111.1 acetyl-CoA acyltransferase [Actinocrispum wychmicini]
MTMAVIVDAVRTPSGRGKPGGALHHVHPAELLAVVLRALVDRSGLDAAIVDDVIAGCVTQSGDQSLNIGRTAVLLAGFPESVPAVTIDRQCGSSQQAVHFAVQGVLAGAYDVAIACGVESMSRAPMFANTRGGDPTGVRDGVIQQGHAAEVVAARWKIGRTALDEYAARSHRLAAHTAAAGGFDRETVPLGTFVQDETIRPGTTAEALAGLAPAFRDAAIGDRFPEIEWRVTAGNSSPLTDGASGVLVMSEPRAAELGLVARARVHAMSVVGSDPLLMLTGVVAATRRVLKAGRLRLDEIDAYEVNEAFAVVPLLWAAELGGDAERLNPRGGAIALGHPLGASGTRLLATLLNHLEDTGGRYGLQTMCEGGGMANAMIIERVTAR